MDQLTVYVVDDNKDAADSLATLLGLMGHHAHPFYNGQDALARAQTEPPHCVMLDIAMAGMDGLELARRFREQFGDDVILVAITGSPADDPRVKATFVTVDHYFVKPVTIEQIQKLFPD
ncbi:response regulator [Comamonas endophytica]|uniref:Response regulator n=1 Tax=Comamonas endophytica TaxID=2949090 RepID=A0ABY6GD41_9BURK|nr:MULTISPECIES: response regulator [unclassified Acidovorax]MCD2512672.1 response regulator [Acidovorax sp. D4N7]UYG52970.1 response regulator [Acidovorax sp. 5MLIR]